MSELGLQLRAALQGDFDREERAALTRVERSVQAALWDFAADEVQGKWRQDIGQSGLRNAGALTKTIRLRRYKNQGLNPAVLVYSNFPIIQRAFEANTVIRSKSGFYLPIPNPDVWPGGRVARPKRNGGQRSNTIALAEQRFGKLRFVYRPGKASLLVAEVRESAARPGTFRRASATAQRTGRGLVTIVVFFLVREARLPRLLRGRVIRDRARQNADRGVEQRFVRYFAQPDLPLQLEGPSQA
ncbi:DUF6441 family protein [Brevundimonas subvibrioides]|uniref:Uncharacterized protein n=1 Tax=Brevundimonas subvibrioides (strain ATCC 15264 / DSM 4735 / LMG 14903 / NBRC 16000 / CB 81) TaxID=633149 RepID=D9QFY2_BRESC|nr:DUF6441 family protein [Brevundimonas subvibrioides]ADL00696.1 conserved hypothetical protein [Brevundimonas subvibrioides ATCC 15264]